MSLVKRRLDEAILAGKLIEQGVDLARLHVECNRLNVCQSVSVGEVPSLDTEEHRSVFCVRISPSGDQALIGLDNEEIQLYSVSGVRNGAVSPAKHVSSTLANDSDLSVTNGKKDRPGVRGNDTSGQMRLVAVPKVGRAEGQPLTGIRFVPHSQLALLASTSGGVLCYNLATPQRLAEVLYSDASNALSCIDCSNDGKRFAAAGSDAAVRIVDTETGTLLQRISSARPYEATQTSGAHTSRVFALKFLTDIGSSAVLFSGGWDQSVKMWDARCGDPLVRSFFGVQICGESIDYENGQLLTGSWRSKDTLQLWDVASGRLIRSGTPTTYIYAAQFFDEGTALAAGSGRNELAYVDLRRMVKVDGENTTSKASHDSETILGLVSFEKPIYTLHGSTSTRKILFGGASPNLQVAVAE